MGGCDECQRGVALGRWRCIEAASVETGVSQAVGPRCCLVFDLLVSLIYLNLACSVGEM